MPDVPALTDEQLNEIEQRAKRAKRKLHATMIAQATKLDEPFTDRTDASPWRTFVRPMIAVVDASFNDMEALAVALRAERDTRQRVEAVCAEVEADDKGSLITHGQHLPGSVVTVAEMVRAALDGSR